MNKKQLKQLGQALIAHAESLPVQWFDNHVGRWKDITTGVSVYGMAQERNMRLRPKP